MEKLESYRYVFWNKEFLEQKNVIANLAAISYDQLVDQLKELDEKTKSGEVVFNELVEICFKIVCRVPVLIVGVDVPYILRCRENQNLQIFKNVSELSYNPFEEKIDFGRFNLKREPLFYAVAPSHTINQFPEELASIFETCKYLRKKDFILTENKYVTIGCWKIAKPFFAVILSLYDDGINKNLTLQNMNKFFEDVFENKFTPESRKIISTLYKYLSQKASCIKESDLDYLITTAFRHALERYYGQEIRAIIYCGAESDNHCINIALTKKVIDEYYIEFYKATMFEIKTTREIVRFSEPANPIRDDYFIFNPIRTPH